MMQFVPNAAKLTAGFDTANFPLIQAWLKKVEARSAYERALARAVPGGANAYNLPVNLPLPFPEVTAPKPQPTVMPAAGAG